MLRINRHFVWSVILILVVLLNLLNVNIARADDSAPPPPPTEEPTQPPVEPTDTPVPEEAPLPTETPVNAEETASAEEQAPVEQVLAEDEPVEEEPVLSEVLADLPENTDLVVLDEFGNPVPLASQAAADAVLEDDPMWCPAGTLPGGTGCRNFTGSNGITNLLSDMRTNTSLYDENGIIYFTSNPGNGSFNLTTSGSSLGNGDFNTLKVFDITLQGGWDGVNGASATFAGQTNFGSNSITIGQSGNPWVGNVTLNNFTFSGTSSSNAVTVYTTNGDITLSNVDVAQQSGGNYTAFLDSNTGDITVQNGSSFDGNNSGNNQNRGFSADTSSGIITISNTTFSDARGCSALFGFCIIQELVNYNGATLSAPTVTLNNVTASNNDLSGIQINNASLVTLNNVTSTNNGTFILVVGIGSGVNVDGTGSTIVNVTGGSLTNNQAFGLSVFNGSILPVTDPTCSGNRYPGPHPSTCYNTMPLDTVAPVLTLPANITVEATGNSGEVVNFAASALDAVDGARPVSCSPASGTIFSFGMTTVNCSSSDASGNTANGSFTVTVQDTTPPTLTLPANITVEATGSSGALVAFPTSANDVVDGPRTVVCVDPSGSTFPITTSTVNCSASDTRGNTANGSFTVIVRDTTAPVLSPMADKNVPALRNADKVVVYSPPTTSDTVDGPGVATCTPPSGSLFPIGDTTVTCSATDSHGNTSSITFNVNVYFTPAGFISPNGSSGFILVTGGELIDLDCSTVANAFGVIVKFHNLCDHQAVLNEINADALPGELPTGYTFVKGMDVEVLANRQALDVLPDDSGVEMDYPLSGGVEYAVLFWNDGQWVEITQAMDEGDLLSILSKDAANELYKMSSSSADLLKVLTTGNTGTFVLVIK